MSYYQFIDGKKFDRSLLEAAEAVIEGKSINKFSINDAERIYGAFLADGKLTASERRTLNYLIQNYPWTIRAKKWIVNELNAVPISKEESAELIIEEQFALHRLKFNLDPNILSAQTTLPNQITFEEALSLALNSFLKDGTKDTSAIRALAKLYDIPFGGEDFRDLLDGILKDHFNHATLTLIPELSSVEQRNYYHFPVEGEQIRNNWIFGLSLHDIPKTYFWAIIDRMGQNPVYNYGAPIELPVYQSPLTNL